LPKNEVDNAEQKRAGEVLVDTGKAVIGGLLDQRPCCVAVTLRNSAMTGRSIDPSGFRLKIAGQTFVPTNFSISDALATSR
jgi:hypothetical protein